MARKKFHVIEALPPGKCELCGKEAETRPYGPNFEQICFPCGMKDAEQTARRFDQKIAGVQ